MKVIIGNRSYLLKTDQMTTNELVPLYTFILFMPKACYVVVNYYNDIGEEMDT